MFIIKCTLILLSVQDATMSKVENMHKVPPYIEAMKNDMSPTLYMTLGQTSKEYIPNELQSILNETRRSDLFWQNRWYGERHYGTYYQRGKGCVLIQMSYKNAIKQVKYYYGFRSLYTENKEYEVGYLTHEIIFRYQIVLELYQLIEGRYFINVYSEVAPTPLLLYFYSNILEECQAIIHLCNMIHEINNKFKYASGIQPKYESAFKDSFAPGEIENVTLSKDELYELYMKKKRKEDIRKAKERKKRLKMYKKFGITTAKVDIYKTKKSRYPLHYGWSIENWPPKMKYY